MNAFNYISNVDMINIYLLFAFKLGPEFDQDFHLTYLTQLLGPRYLYFFIFYIGLWAAY